MHDVCVINTIRFVPTFFLLLLYTYLCALYKILRKEVEERRKKEGRKKKKEREIGTSGGEICDENTMRRRTDRKSQKTTY